MGNVFLLNEETRFHLIQLNVFCLYFPVIQKKIEQEKRRRQVLINEHNRLTFAVKEKEAKLKELQESLTAMNLQPTNYNSEDTCKQVSVHPETCACWSLTDSPPPPPPQKQCN